MLCTFVRHGLVSHSFQTIRYHRSLSSKVNGFSNDSKTENSQMLKKIFREMDDRVGCLGGLVAYKINSDYFRANNEFILKDESIRFAYIRKSALIGYEVLKLVKLTDASHSTTSLTDYKLEFPISLRLVSYDEESIIRKEILTDQAELECMFDKEKINAILDAYTGKGDRFDQLRE